jgi:adenylate cyclase
MTPRQRRDWRIILGVSVGSAIVSAWFGYVSAPPEASVTTSMAIGVLSSLVIATPIVLFEVKNRRWRFLRAARSLPLVVYFGLRLLLYVVVIVGGLALVRMFAVMAEPKIGQILTSEGFLFAIIMAVAGNFAFQMGGLLGFGTMKNLLTGRYVQPRRETRAFLLIDMKDSTGLAERLGPIRFHALLNAFFRDVADAALEFDAEIHKYVGDEAILCWTDGAAVSNGDCLACVFAVRNSIRSNSDRYTRHYGAVPEFRAALHYGEIVAGEIGDVRREIAYVGETLNVAARLLDAAKQLGKDVLVSREVLDRTKLPEGVRTEALPTLSVRGHSAPLEIAALTHGAGGR